MNIDMKNSQTDGVTIKDAIGGCVYSCSRGVPIERSLRLCVISSRKKMCKLQTGQVFSPHPKQIYYPVNDAVLVVGKNGN